MIAGLPPHHQFIPTPCIPTCSCSQCSASPNTPHTFSSNSYLQFPVNRSTSLDPMANATTSDNKSYPGQPSLVKTPGLYIPSAAFCKTTPRTPDNIIPTCPTSPIMGGSKDFSREPAFNQRQLLSPQADVLMEAFPNGSLARPSLDSSDSESMKMINALPNNDSESSHPADYISPTSESCSAVSTLAESDVVVDRNANILPLFTTEPLKSRADPMMLMTSQNVDPHMRKCATQNCDGFILSGSTCLRCVKCIKADWASIKARGLCLLNKPHSGLVSILRHDYSDKGKQKSVSWADQENDWMSRIKRVHLKLPEQRPSTRLIEEETVEPSLPVRSESSQVTKPTSPTSKQKEILLEDSCLWDSDLSELTESSEESDSETEESELDSSSSEEISDSESESELPKLIIRIPARRPSAGNSKIRPERNRPPVVFTPYPEYRCQRELVADFHARVSGFLDALGVHSLYMRPGNRDSKSVFGFEGQYSVVALDRNLFGRIESIQSDVLELKEQLGNLAVIEFDGDAAVTVNDNGIFMHFLCVHRFYNPLGPFYADQEPRIMHGEFEIAALPDDSHHILPGQRFVVRFRMVG